jgi:hypothetical protein
LLVAVAVVLITLSTQVAVAALEAIKQPQDYL